MGDKCWDEKAWGKKGWVQSSALLKYCTSSPEDVEWLNMGH